ncbi:MAG TPA: class I SAM-dependent methyltransferase [Pyrinomonadaceae bacterium]|nr:class I SAM-dependent methyltransferase [Pyrinomonadaceae bacterium]
MTTPRQLLRNTLHQMGIVNVRGHLAFIKRRGMKYSSIFPYEGIPGWLSEDEAITLFEIALSLPNERPVGVEIGSWVGKSSLVLSKGMKGKTEPKLYCIDPFNGDADVADRAMYGREMRKFSRTLEEIFRDNMQKHGVLDVVRPLVGYSYEFAADFKEPIDFLFIDGNHDYEAVLQDYEQWSPLLKTGGTIAFHDVVLGENPDPVGPGQVAKEHIFDSPKWTNVKLVDALLVAQKTA